MGIHNIGTHFLFYLRTILTFFSSKLRMLGSETELKHQITEYYGKLSKADIEIVMDRLGMSYTELDGDKIFYEERFGAEELAKLIEEEPSLDEVKEAFDLLDENKDGFIDAAELRRMLLCLGVKEGSELEECKRMIGAADENKDGHISFSEFVKFMETSFS